MNIMSSPMNENQPDESTSSSSSSSFQSKEIDFYTKPIFKLGFEIEANFDLCSFIHDLNPFHGETDDKELQKYLDLWKAAQVVWIYQHDLQLTTSSSESSDVNLSKVDLWGLTSLEANNNNISSKIMSSVTKWQQTLIALFTSFLSSSVPDTEPSNSSFYMIPNPSQRDSQTTHQSLNDLTAALSRTTDGSFICILSGVHQSLRQRLEAMEIPLLKVVTSVDGGAGNTDTMAVDARQLSTHGRTLQNSQGSVLLIKGQIDISLAFDVIVDAYISFICSSKYRPNIFRLPDLVSQCEFPNAVKSSLTITSFDCRENFPVVSKSAMVSEKTDNNHENDENNSTMENRLVPTVSNRRHKIRFEGIVFMNTIPSLVTYLQKLATSTKERSTRTSTEYLSCLEGKVSRPNLFDTSTSSTSAITNSRTSVAYKNPFSIISSKAKLFQNIPTATRTLTDSNIDSDQYFFLLSFNSKSHPIFQSKLDAILSIASIAQSVPDFTDTKEAAMRWSVTAPAGLQSVRGSLRLRNEEEKKTVFMLTESTVTPVSVTVIALIVTREENMTDSDADADL